MEPVFPQLTRVGGSHAQRMVFEDTLLEACLRAEEFDKATAMLQERLSKRESPRDNYWMARAQQGLGDLLAAQESLEVTREGWQEADTNTVEYANFAEMA